MSPIFVIMVMGPLIGSMLSYLEGSTSPLSGLELFVFLSPIVLPILLLAISPLVLMQSYFASRYIKTGNKEYNQLANAFTHLAALAYSVLLCIVVLSFAKQNPYTGW